MKPVSFEMPEGGNNSDVNASIRSLLSIVNQHCSEAYSARCLERLDDVRFGLITMVLGEGGFGKSSLINQLAGIEMAKTAVIPKTFKVDLYVPSADGDDYAEVRKVGENERQRLTLGEAEQLDAADEARIRTARKRKEIAAPELIEATWYRRGIQLHPDICLADTPGLAQDLLGKVKSFKLDTGGIVHQDDVWALWYHRADVVLWCFPATRIEARDTRETLEILTQKFKKRIIPVATKCDEVGAPELWPEIEKKWRETYRDLFPDERTPFFLTVTKPGHENCGAGIEDLRHYLSGLAEEARAEKLAASEQFLIDTAREVHSVLKISAGELNSNLQTIGSAIDDVASQAIQETRFAVSGANEFIEKYREQHTEEPLRDMLDRLCSETASRHQSGHSATTLSEYCQRELNEFLSVSSLKSKINQRLNDVGQQVERYGRAVSKTKKLNQVEIRSSGETTRETLEFEISIPIASANINL
ncbi:MAG: dynamin family protein, partial [Verrucomicrobiota bacterium]